VAVGTLTAYAENFIEPMRMPRTTTGSDWGDRSAVLSSACRVRLLSSWTSGCCRCS